MNKGVSFLLDTSVYSQPIKNVPVPSVIARWKSHGEREYAVSALCELEVLFGIARSQSPRLRKAYEEILVGRFPVIPFDRRCALVYAELQAGFEKEGRPRPAFDLMIAATALVHDLELATLNVSDFQGISGLRIADWGLPPQS